MEHSLRVLIPGCGIANETWDAKWRSEGFEICRLDIDPRTFPDVVANITDMGEIGTYDVVYCCHALEHLYPHEVPKALQEFHRVLNPGGCAVIMVPDLEDVKPTETRLPNMEYPMNGLHLFYGDATQIEHHPAMAHHCGFVKETLGDVLLRAGFRNVNVRRIAAYNLIGTGMK